MEKIPTAPKKVRKPTASKKPFSFFDRSEPACIYILGARHRVDDNGVVVFRRYTKRDDVTLAKVTAKYFPDGFTVIEHAGNWRDSSDLIQEDSRTILVVGGEPAKHEGWRNDIVATFQQEKIVRIPLSDAEIFVTGRGLTRMTPPKLRKNSPE